VGPGGGWCDALRSGGVVRIGPNRLSVTRGPDGNFHAFVEHWNDKPSHPARFDNHKQGPFRGSEIQILYVRFLSSFFLQEKSLRASSNMMQQHFETKKTR
jgi:hypothetical protein